MDRYLVRTINKVVNKMMVKTQKPMSEKLDALQKKRQVWYLI